MTNESTTRSVVKILTTVDRLSDRREIIRRVHEMRRRRWYRTRERIFVGIVWLIKMIGRKIDRMRSRGLVMMMRFRRLIFDGLVFIRRLVRGLGKVVLLILCPLKSLVVLMVVFMIANTMP